MKHHKKTRKLVVIFSLLISIFFHKNVHAQNFLLIESFDNKSISEIFLDLDSINFKGSIVSLNQIINFSQPSTLPNLQGSISNKTIHEYDCINQKRRSVESFSYSELNLKGNLVNSLKFTDLNWSGITRPEHKIIYSIVCKTLYTKNVEKNFLSYTKDKENNFLYAKDSIKKMGDLYDLVLIKNIINSKNNKNFKSTIYFVTMDCINEEYSIDNEIIFSDSFGNGKIQNVIFEKNKIWKRFENSENDVKVTYDLFCGESKKNAARVGPILQEPLSNQEKKFEVVFQPNQEDYYPSFSKRAGEQGETIVNLIIDKHGLVREVKVIKSSGYQRLDDAALEIAKDYKFRIYKVNNIPTELSTNLLIRFNLKK
jgi:TonB family protein